MVLLRAQTAWERVIVPAFVYFFAQLYPFRKVNDPRSRTAAGAGGCMLIRRSDLDAAGGLAPIRGALIDDVAFGTLLKRNGWALMTVSYLPMLRFYRLSPLRAPALPLVALLYAAMTADSARRHYSGRAVSWRGRAAERV